MTIVLGLRQGKERLANLGLDLAIGEALEMAAQELEANIIDVLSQPPGQDHSVPWLRTGALRDSIGHEVDGAVAVVGSSSDVAVDQELGTRAIPPRPFLASTAAGAADHLTALIAATLSRHLAGR
jgi:hypothetical protein